MTAYTFNSELHCGPMKIVDATGVRHRYVLRVNTETGEMTKLLLNPNLDPVIVDGKYLELDLFAPFPISVESERSK